MRFIARGWPVLLVLAAWLVLGPVGMAFDNCAAMMVLCDGSPCGVVAAVTLAVPALTAPKTIVATSLASPLSVPVVTARAVEPPPKSFSLPA